IKNKSTSSIMIVGEQHAARRHRVLGVMHPFCLLIGDQRGHQMTVRWRSRVGIDHGEKIVAFLCRVPGPGEKIMAAGSRLGRLTKCRQRGTSRQQNHRDEAWHSFSSNRVVLRREDISRHSFGLQISGTKRGEKGGKKLKGP